MTSQRSWLITALFAAACGVAAAIVNASLFRSMDTCATCRLTIVWRLGAALLGAVLLARFVIESMSAPIAPSMCVTAVIAWMKTFFTTKRVFQLLGIVVCLAVQFVIFEAPSDEHGHGKRRPVHMQRDRLTA